MLAATFTNAMLLLGWMALAGLIIQASMDPDALLAEFDDSDEAWQRERLDALEYCIESYREFSATDDWNSRLPIDRQVSRDAGGISARHLDRLLHEHPGDLAVATAVAVCIGDGYASDDAAQLCRLYAELLASPHERVRYRASQSVIQRVFDDTLPENAAPALLAAVNGALRVERGELNRPSLDYAQQLLEHQLTPPVDEEILPEELEVQAVNTAQPLRPLPVAGAPA